MFIHPEVKFLPFAFMHPWILATLISANNQALNCKGLAVTVCFVATYRASAQVWDCMKRSEGKRCLHSSMLYLCRVLPGHCLCIHALDLSAGPWWRWVHLSLHCLSQMNGVLSWRSQRCCHAANFFKASGYVRSLRSQAGILCCVLIISHAWSGTIKPPLSWCMDCEHPYNCSFFQGFLPLRGNIIKSVNYSICFISQGCFLSPRSCIVFELSNCCWETYALTLWPSVYILEKLLEVI